VADLNRAIGFYQLNTPARLQHFLAQTSTESSKGRNTVEPISGSDYEGRKDLLNTFRGDGAHFKGAGFI
jgi:predicted chitinase